MIAAAEPASGHWTQADPYRQPLLICIAMQSGLPAPLHLSPEEIACGNALSHADTRRGFLLQHHLLRGFLSHWLDIAPAELKFVRNAHGKPALDAAGVHFSISRSRQSLAFYFGPLAGGIDVEQCRDSQPFKAIVDAHFHPNEQPLAQSDHGFFCVWTRKEALLKAAGTGLRDDLSAFDCTRQRVDLSGRTYSLSTFQAPCHLLSLALADSEPVAPLYFTL